MTTKRTRLRDSRSWRFDLGLCVLGLALLAWSLPVARAGGWEVGVAALICVPLVVVVARFPMVLDSEDGGIEIGFDSIVLMYLLCTFDARRRARRVGARRHGHPADLRQAGVGLRLQHRRRHPRRRQRRRVAAPGARVRRRARRGSWWPSSRPPAAYFFLDYVSRPSRSPSTPRHPVRGHLVQPGTWLAVACFVPFDLLGYLAAVVLRSSPWWTLVLLVVPLVTLLLATRAITRGRENARRLTVLLEAAVRVQALHEPDPIDRGAPARRPPADPAARRGACAAPRRASTRSARRYAGARTRSGSWPRRATGPARRSAPTSTPSTRSP